MHTVHHTDAFILKSQPAGEANRRVWLFTQDFGLVVAVVQGVRKQGAKLQMQLLEYSSASVDLVRGRDVWRLVSISHEENPFIGKNPNGLGRAYVRTLSTIERFCHGEEAHPELFLHIRECFEGLRQKELDVRSFDTLAVWRAMVLLGYCAVEDEDRQLFEIPFTEAVGMLSDSSRTRLIKVVNGVIAETHL